MFSKSYTRVGLAYILAWGLDLFGVLKLPQSPDEMVVIMIFYLNTWTEIH